MTGLDLYGELERAARRSGVGVQKFVAPLSNYPTTWLDQLQQARSPKPRTIERVRALIDGKPIPPAQGVVPGVVTCTRSEREARGLPPSARMEREATSLSATASARAAVELTRQLTELAHASRRPGQTIADRVRELRRERTDADVHGGAAMSAPPAEIMDLAKSLARVLEERDFARTQKGVEHVQDQTERPRKRAGRR